METLAARHAAHVELELATMKKIQALEQNNNHQQIMKTSMVNALEKELRLKTKKLKALTRERTREKEMKEQVALADRAIEQVRKEQRKTVTLHKIEQIKARRKSSAVARVERRKTKRSCASRAEASASAMRS